MIIMTENMKKFIEQASKDGALKVELDALSKEFSGKEQIEQNKGAIQQKTIAIAAKHGFTLKKEEFVVELNEEQLKAVAGGGLGTCVCILNGSGKCLGKTGDGWCRCYVGGVGKDGTRGDAGAWCVCVVGGGGTTGPNG
jgi:hypothetical protein